MKKLFLQIKQLFIDLRNRKKFKEELSVEINDPESKFNNFELKMDDSFSRLSVIIPIPEEFQIAGTDMDIMNKLKEIVKPITNYICFELGWAEYILVPEFYYLDDPQNPGQSRTYLVMWQYKSIVLDDTAFWWKFIGFLLGCGAVIGGITTALIMLI